MFRKIIMTSAAAALLATPALADDIEIHLDSVFGKNISYTFNDGETSFDGTTKAGIFNWTVVNGDGGHFQDGMSFNSFCVELVQTTSGTQTYSVVDPTQVPDPNGSLDDGMTDQQVGLLASLVDQHWDEVTTTSDKNVTAAFQLAVWEIVYEGESVDFGDGEGVATGLSTEDGWFQVNQGDATATSLANSWLANLVTDGLTGRLAGLFNANRQDQLTVVPLPAPIALAGLGLAGVIAGRRRLRGLAGA